MLNEGKDLLEKFDAFPSNVTELLRQGIYFKKLEMEVEIICFVFWN